MNSSIQLPSDEQMRQSRELVAHLHGSEIYRTYSSSFETATGLPLALRAVGELQSPLTASRLSNPLCTLLGRTSHSCAGCLRHQHDIEEQCADGAQTSTCFAGLLESAIPIRIGTRIIAYLQTGQVVHHVPTQAAFRRTTQQLDAWGAEVDRDELKKAFFASPVVPKLRYESIVRLLGIFADHLAVVTNQVMVKQAAAELPAVARARAYIAEHLGDEISLGEVAKAVGMSPFYFCKTFHKVTGLTFVDYVARLRVENVKNLLLNPHKRISEAAFEAGFQSLSQFNRVFRRVAGEPPTVYRDKLHDSGPQAAAAA